MTDRRAREGRKLASWLADHAHGLGLIDAALPESEWWMKQADRQALSAEGWRDIGAALAAAVAMEADASPDRWADAIALALGLDDLERQLLALALHYETGGLLRKLYDELFDGSHYAGLMRNAARFALLLGAGRSEVERRLAPNGVLLQTGLLRLNRHGALEPLGRLETLVKQGFAPQADLFGQLLGASRPAELPWDAFAHLGVEAETAAAVLSAALDGRERGINLLLYGPPGTGKTCFAATLAQRVGAVLRPVCEADESGNEPTGWERLAGLRLAQGLVAANRAVLLFDEAEDLFPSRGRQDEFDDRANSRVYMHRLLERTGVPVIFTANDIGALGPAVLRRMTMCLELRVPGLATRSALWRRLAAAEGVALADPEARRLARMVPAAPALASASLRAARLGDGGASMAEIIVAGVARAVNGGVLPLPDAEPSLSYDPALVNADCDLPALADALARPEAPRAVSLLISGPAGTGKSAWVRHLAGRMGVPVLQKRASDVLGAFVGETEARIAAAFAEARDTGSFLVFDEADGLLLDRTDAVRGWEVSQVNEMLTWMEAHPLPFACTTNLPERLDRASLRRFLVKLRFGWLTAAQVRLAFRRFFGVEAPAKLAGLETSTSADFDVVRRRAALRAGSVDPSWFISQLREEAAGRRLDAEAIGFVAPR